VAGPKAPKWLLDKAHAQAERTMTFDPTQSYGENKAEVVSKFEREYLTWLLTRHTWNVSAAAREARMDRKHLSDMAKKHGIRRSRPTKL
jgi:DNA-binding NtrC family response regulator